MRLTEAGLAALGLRQPLLEAVEERPENGFGGTGHLFSEPPHVDRNDLDDGRLFEPTESLPPPAGRIT